MVHWKFRSITGMCLVVAIVLTAAAESQACEFLDRLFGRWCGGWCGTQTQTTTFQPIYTPTTYSFPTVTSSTPVAASPASSCVQQTCQYVPQTCYRTVYQRRPVVSYQPVVSTDACTGCAVTTYRPVTTWVNQARLVPYTTYRLVYSNGFSGSVSNVSSSGTCCAPSTTSSIAPTPAAPTPAAPAPTAPTAAPNVSPDPGYTPGANSVYNGTQTAPNGTTPPRSTFDSTLPQGTQKPITPAPAGTNTDVNKTDVNGPEVNKTGSPRLITPSNQPPGRQASLGRAIQLVSSPPQPTARPLTTTSNGWRAARN